MSPFWLIRAHITNKRPQYAKQLQSSTARKWRRLIIAPTTRCGLKFIIHRIVVGSFGWSGREKGRQNWLSRLKSKGAMVNLNPMLLDGKQNNADHYSLLSTDAI